VPANGFTAGAIILVAVEGGEDPEIGIIANTRFIVIHPFQFLPGINSIANKLYFWQSNDIIILFRTKP
jgi:hypothetical protein